MNGRDLAGRMVAALFFCCLMTLLSLSSARSAENCRPLVQEGREVADLSEAMDDIAHQFCFDACTGGSGEGRRPAVLVADFVAAGDFVPNVEGIFLTDLFRRSLNSDCCQEFIQAEFSRFFKASGRGIELLGQPGEGIPRGISPDALVGSYWCQGDRMTLLVKKINMRTGIVSQVVSREINLN